MQVAAISGIRVAEAWIKMLEHLWQKKWSKTSTTVWTMLRQWPYQNRDIQLDYYSSTSTEKKWSKAMLWCLTISKVVTVMCKVTKQNCCACFKTMVMYLRVFPFFHLLIWSTEIYWDRMNKQLFPVDSRPNCNCLQRPCCLSSLALVVSICPGSHHWQVLEVL